MDLEQLNKTQIILLTLLVSFVSAIATSIFTVKILEEAPPAITQTINRVVERTVERVVPAEPSEGNTEQTVIEKETTVVVKEDDLITESIDRNKKRIVRLVTVTETEGPPLGTSTEPTIKREFVFHGIGVLVSSDGLIATASFITDIPDLIAVADDGTEYEANTAAVAGNIGYLRASLEGETPSFSPVTFVDDSTLKLGQTVIALGGEERTSVATGIIASFIGEDTTTAVRTNIGGSIPGSPLVNIFGEVVGIDVSQTPGVFTASDLIETGIPKQESEEAAIETTENPDQTLEG